MNKNNDINIKINEVNFCCRSCAIITNDDKILFQKRKNDKFWALPGGKIEILETTKDTIARELKEELDIKDIVIGNVISITENFFEIDGIKVHQYIFTHKVESKDINYNNKKGIFKGKEDKDILFTWIKKENIAKTPIKPDYLINQILNNNKDIEFYTNIE